MRACADGANARAVQVATTAAARRQTRARGANRAERSEIGMGEYGKSRGSGRARAGAEAHIVETSRGRSLAIRLTVALHGAAHAIRGATMVAVFDSPHGCLSRCGFCLSKMIE
ncbi:hypothetical protein OH687_03230 [Burkholderia anthina]|nr:hypothetical protein OH687_03230 [Burkholderia anthina]